jgi:23S rRNA pseudouridine1911/1915/1917 synthase
MNVSPVEQRILFEDNHLLIVNKVPGELVQPDKDHSLSLEDTLKDYLRKNNGKAGNIYLGVIHRIDRPVSGTVIFAKSSKALSRMNRLLQEKKISKTYWAIVNHKPEKNEATLVHYLVRNSRNNTVKAFNNEKEGSQRAELKYRFLAASENYYLLEVILITGRHHQIRAQLSHCGMEIKGDLKYGAPRSNPDGSISLHARSVSFQHPVTLSEMNIIAPVPHDKLWQYFEKNG